MSLHSFQSWVDLVSFFFLNCDLDSVLHHSALSDQFSTQLTLIFIVMILVLIFHLLWCHTELLNLKILRFMMTEKKSLTLNTFAYFLHFIFNALILDLTESFILAFNKSLMCLLSMFFHHFHVCEYSAHIMTMVWVQLT